MAKATTYINKTGSKIDRKEWQKLAEDKSYTVSREFKNQDYRVAVLWEGIVDGSAPSMYWEPWYFSVETFNGEKWVHDPFSSTKCSSETEAIKHYETFLDNYSDCTLKIDVNTGERHFREVGNELEPPPPPDPDIPIISESTNELAGSW